MKTNMIFLLIMLTLLGISTSFAQQDPKAKGLEVLTEPMMRSQLNFLASDYMEGRATVERGGRLAAEYIATQFEVAGLLPAGDIINGKRSYLQSVPLILTKENTPTSFKVISQNATTLIEDEFEYLVDYVGNPPRNSKHISADIVFAGYGLINEEAKINDFKGIDVKDKVVVIMDLDYFSSDKNKVMLHKTLLPDTKILNRKYREAGMAHIRNNGALAIITLVPMDAYLKIAGNNATNTRFYSSERISPTRYRLSLLQDKLNASLPSYTVSPKIANLLFKDSGISLEAYENDIKNGAKPNGKVIKNRRISLSNSIKSEVVVSYNVLGMIRGENSSQNVVVGGHYDHMGIKDNFIWNGADDNASGTVAVMSIAKAFTATGEKPLNNVIFAAWTGEENGILGSKHFVNNFSNMFHHSSIIMNMNFDMLSRNDKNDKDGNIIDIEYSEENMDFIEINRENIKKYNINLVITESPVKAGRGSGTDYLSFFSKGIPFMGWFSGYHPDYHQYGDDVSKTNYKKFYNAIRLGFLDTWDIVNKK